MALPHEGNTDFFTEIARGKEGFTFVHKFGHTYNASTTSNPIWSEGGAYTYLTAADYLLIASDDTNDNSASTGARTIQIYGVDGNYASQNETVTLNGFVGVTTANQYLRIFRMVVRSAGTSGWNEGAIKCIPDAAGNTFTAAGVPTTTSNILAALETTTNQTLMAIYTVPLSYSAFLIKSFANVSANNEVEVDLYQRPEGEVFQIKERYHIYRSTGIVEHKVPVPIEAKTDIELRAKGSTSAADVSGGFDLILINE